jgi:polysaccharide pyruvyl transferase WcaK-like protein
MGMIHVGLIGYFGSGAYSDDLIEHVTKRLLLEARPDLTFDSTLLSRGEAASNPDYLNSFDLLIHCGGSLLGKCTHYPVRDIAKWVDKVKTPLAIFGLGYRFEPDKEPLAPEMRERIRLLFEKSGVISVRGAYTVNHLKENGIDVSKISSLADPVMACDIPIKRTPTDIVGNVRDMSSVEVQHTQTYRVHHLFAECYDWLIDKYDLPLLLISWRHNLRDDNDVSGAHKVINLMRNKEKVETHAPANYLEAIKLMRFSRFYFGQRLHPTIFAATQGIPFVGLEYQFDKMLDWASTVGIDNVIHTRDATLESFIEAHKRVEGNMAKLRETMPLKAAEIRATAKKIVELI